ncbi:MAG: hypothetical protein DBX05_06200 [Candidatus Poseidoniales archaeon]|nr:MAG: hypothetical protein DBX05_06200 [Candidatus Poseidoniales archaeon]
MVSPLRQDRRLVLTPKNDEVCPSRQCMAVILLCNDDGVESPYILGLASELQRRGHHILLYAPMNDQSGRSMALTLRKDVETNKRNDLLNRMNLDSEHPMPSIHEIDGTPCDCIILAIDGYIEHNGDPKPDLCISGINVGPNMSVDLLHSGTVAAAREASLYGLPSIASSIAKHDPSVDPTMAIRLTSDLAEAVLKYALAGGKEYRRPRRSDASIDFDDEDSTLGRMFGQGEIYLNLNIPENCTGRMQASTVGARWYTGACNIHVDGESKSLRVGSLAIEDDDIEGAASDSLSKGHASLTCLASWPQLHPLNVGDKALNQANTPGSDGLPRWI